MPSALRQSRLLPVTTAAAGVVLAASLACRPRDPVRVQFENAAKQQGDMVSDYFPDDVDVSTLPMNRFVKAHGRSAVPVYLEVIDEYRHGSSAREIGLMHCALKGLSAEPDAAARQTLMNLARDAKVHPLIRGHAVMALAAGETGASLIRLLGSQLQWEPYANNRRSLIGDLLRTANPAAKAYFREAARLEKDESVAVELRIAIDLLEQPGRCKLLHQRKHAERQLYCQYRCSGPRSSYSVDSEVECGQWTDSPPIR